MRKFLLSFLMLIMLTPSLACAMPICADPVEAAATEQPCAGHTSHGESKKEDQSGKVMLLKDCMGLELQVADSAASIQKPDLVKAIPFILAADIQTVPFWTVSDNTGIRGPPPDWPGHSQTRPSILLTTQRLRI